VPRSILTLVIAVLAVGAAADRFASAADGTRTDRSVKLDLIQKLRHGPQLMILGDSRGREAEPSFLQQLTGLSGFNAAVTGGTAPDGWVFTRYTRDLFPHQKRRYIWFVSAGLAGNIINPYFETDPRSQRYLKEVTPYLSSETDDVPWTDHSRYHADGSLADRQRPFSPSRARKLKARAAQLVDQIRRHPPRVTSVDLSHFQLFEHLVAYMNQRGSRPVIVFNPVYPTVLTELAKYGNPVLTSSLQYLRSVRSRFDFVVVNCEDSRKWGGNDYDWANPTHVGRGNMRRLLKYVVAHAGSALK
jgi:hypothetical protein